MKSFTTVKLPDIAVVVSGYICLTVPVLLTPVPSPKKFNTSPTYVAVRNKSHDGGIASERLNTVMLKSIIGCANFLNGLAEFNSVSDAITKLPENSPEYLGDWSVTFRGTLPNGETKLEE